MAIDNEEIYNKYIKPELKTVYMSDEYAAQYWHQQGWTACRLAYKIYDDAEKAGAFRV